MEYAKLIVWPCTAILVVVAFLLIFRKDVSALIERIQSISKNGIRTASSSQVETRKEVEASADELMRVLDSEVLREQEELIKKDLEKRIPSDRQKRVEILTRHLAIFQLSTRFEYINGLIFGSQIKLLQDLNSKNGDTIDNLRFYYDFAVKQYPDFYKGYPFELYLDFLLSNTLILQKNDLYFITKLGREFLGYLVATARTGFRHY